MTYTYDCVWLPANHFLFQLANVCLVFSYFCPPSLNGLIALRFFLGLAGLFFALWGWLVLCALDTFLWNLVFFVGNFTHLGYILFSRRPIKFSEEMEGVYEKLFKPHGVPRHQFKILAEAAKLETEFMYPGKIYMIEGVTLTDSLSIIAKGRYVRTILVSATIFRLYSDRERSVLTDAKSGKFTNISRIFEETNSEQ